MGGGGGVGFWSYALWRVPHGAVERLELAQNRSQMVLTAIYPTMALGMLVYLAVADRKERAPADYAVAKE